MLNDSNLFDLSDYPKEFKTLKGNLMHNPINCKVIGKMKDEGAGAIIIEFAGLRSKSYCVKDTKTEIKKAKGIPKMNVKNDLELDNYKEVLFSEGKKITVHNFTKFQSKNHNIMTINQLKIGLTGSDNKRDISGDKIINTLPWGHKDGVSLPYGFR
jgi:hypothetical protein